jgi:hypothetical protein
MKAGTSVAVVSAHRNNEQASRHLAVPGKLSHLAKGEGCNQNADRPQLLLLVARAAAGNLLCISGIIQNGFLDSGDPGRGLETDGKQTAVAQPVTAFSMFPGLRSLTTPRGVS